MPRALLIEKGGSGGGGGVVLQRIEIATPPTQVEYLAGDVFNDTGMVLKGYYGVGGTTLTPDGVLLAGYNVTPNPLTDGTTEVTITYSETGITCTATQPITVRRKLTSITLDSAPTKTTYEYSDTLVTTGMVVRAHYSDGSSAVVSGATCSPTTFNARGTQEVTVSYTENQVYAVTKTTTFNVTVERKTVTEPSWKGTLTYSGVSQSATGTSLWNNYNTSYMSIGGTTSGTNATSYTARFTAGANYRFGVNSGNDVTTADVSWSIAKKTLNPIVSSPSTEITKGSLTQYVTISGLDNYYTGTISATKSPSTGVTIGPITGSGATRSIPVTGDGNTPGSFIITVSFDSDSNYNTISNKTATVVAKYFEWGSEDEIASKQWWADLADWVGTASASDLNACIGKTKKVTVNFTVTDITATSTTANTHLVRCIGYNCDRNKYDATANTLTFHVANIVGTNATYYNGDGQSSTTMLWKNSYIRNKLCGNYEKALKDAIGSNILFTTTQGSAAVIDSSQAAMPEYRDECVFLPSDAQMGFPSGHDYSNGKGQAASYDEFDVNNTGKTAYQYYTTNDRRIKKLGDSGSNTVYWERSLSYNGTSRACIVDTGGKPYGGDHSGSYGFAPAFILGKHPELTFDWGDEIATADSTWWANLNNWLATATEKQLSECVGKTKSITLSSAVQGTTTHLVQCIGFNCDRAKSNTGRNTLTFQTKNCLATNTVFGSSNGVWVGSTVRNLCTTYYNALPMKSLVKQVSKGTCGSTNSSQTGAPTYNDEYVFLPSDCEMGFEKGCTYKNNLGYSASYDEFCAANADKRPYQYYINWTRRIKYNGDGGTSAQYYWERSFRCTTTTSACYVSRDGRPDNGAYDGRLGFAPAFVI